MALRLTLVCHAGTDAQRAGRFPADEPIEAAGVAAAAMASSRLGRVDRALTSPALRARQTAEAMGLPADIEPALRDVDYGRWRGQSLMALQAADPEATARALSDPDAAPHGGETLRAVLARVAAWLETERCRAGRIVAVTHPAVIRAAIIQAIGATPAAFPHLDVAPLAFVALTFNGRWRLHMTGPEPAPGKAAGRAPESR